jgi:hypothetical protein
MGRLCCWVLSLDAGLNSEMKLGTATVMPISLSLTPAVSKGLTWAYLDLNPHFWLIVTRLEIPYQSIRPG